MNHEIYNLTEHQIQWDQAEQLDNGILREYIGIREQQSENQEALETLFGDPEDSENWHMQAEALSCTVSIQELVGEQLLGRDLSEQAMIDHAKSRGWYDPAEGASKANTGKLLEEMGFEVHRADGQTLQDLLEALSEGEKVICGVDTHVLQNADMADLPGRKANHVLQLAAVDFADPEHPQAIVNDMGTPDGKGKRYDLDVFMKAWAAGNHFAVTVGKGAAM